MSPYDWDKELKPEKDIFLSGAQVLVNPVNCVGAMGKGLAKEFKKRYPSMFIGYKQDCNLGIYKPGYCYLSHQADNQWIANIPTKQDWRDPSKKEWVVQGIKNLVQDMAKSGGWYRTQRLTSVAIPRIGCGLGGLDWNEIRPLIIQELKGCYFDVWLDGEIFLRDKNGINQMKSAKTNSQPTKDSFHESSWRNLPITEKQQRLIDIAQKSYKTFKGTTRGEATDYIASYYKHKEKDNNTITHEQTK